MCESESYEGNGAAQGRNDGSECAECENACKRGGKWHTAVVKNDRNDGFDNSEAVREERNEGSDHPDCICEQEQRGLDRNPDRNE
ncbi:MAG: hypothetical protein QOE62_2598 [Actinomycetota bacterium]|nr:hypothetical protein [Actinomycetota bacterium]